ncbi:hypothetical protein Ae201684P_000087 [Aphanomyces euteiches]|nr:hypothetical protein Ae201684P_000087 [Aphanomyces euteiches]KAH9131981.1 hypothetical protein AeRB84_021488 [Aphanomyces euteiches]
MSKTETTPLETEFGTHMEDNPTFLGDEDDEDLQENNNSEVMDFKKSLIELFQERKFYTITSRLQAGILTEEDYSNIHGYSIVSYAALLGKEDILRLILKRVNCKKIHDFTYDPIFQATKENQIGTVKILLENVKDIDLQSTLNSDGKKKLE